MDISTSLLLYCMLGTLMYCMFRLLMRRIFGTKQSGGKHARMVDEDPGADAPSDEDPGAEIRRLAGQLRHDRLDLIDDDADEDGRALYAL